jgi:hypothetical protein
MLDFARLDLDRGNVPYAGWCWRKRESLRGYHYWVWEKAMPYIPENLLDCAVYLFPSVEAAQKGESVGGSGFLVGMPAAGHPGTWFLYAVTAAHVIEGGSRVVRLNTVDGAFDVLDLSAGWVPRAGGDDVAACPLRLNAQHRFHFIQADEFVTPQILKDFLIGPGDEVFMVGRFVGHQGTSRNAPTLRFGNVSMISVEPVWQGRFRPRYQDSFLVEMRSVSGYSGSPVVVYWGTVGGRPHKPDGGMMWASVAINKSWLLGVNWGHLPRETTVLDAAGRDSGLKVAENTAMATVLPAWTLRELLDQHELAIGREIALASLKSEDASWSGAEMDST